MVFGLGKKRREKKASAEAEKNSTKKQIPPEEQEQTAPVSNEVKPGKKKKVKENELTGVRDGKRRGKKKKIIRSGSKGYNSPLRTIAEDEEGPRTRDTEKSDGSVLNSVNVMALNPDGESTEVVMSSSLEERGEEVKLEDAPREESPTNEDVRKTQFSSGEGTPTATVTPAQESPFDEEAEFSADEIAELNKSLADEADAEDESGPASRDDSSSPRPMEPKSAVARKLLDAFNCGDDTTRGMSRATAVPGLDLVINNMCGPMGNKKQPRFDPEMTVDFLRETIKRGLPLLYHQPPDDDDVDPDEEWTGRSVHMTIKLGSYLGTHLLQPRLEWSTLGGGWSRTGSPDITSTSVELLNISSILGELEDERDDFGASADDLCFFTVTTNKGNVYLFEAVTSEDRDRIVYGLRSVIARLSFHLIAGDSTVSSELYGEEKLSASGELPSLRTPTQGLNEISHAFLD